MQQALATVAIAFDHQRSRAVISAIAQMGHPAHPAVKAALDATGRVHFMSMSVVPPDEAGPAHLLLELTADGGTAAALALVAEHLGKWLLPVFAAADLAPAPTLAAFLCRHRITPGQGWRAALNLGGQTVGLAFSGAPGLSVRRILDEQALACRIGDMTALLAGPGTPFEKLERVRADLWSAGEKWAFFAEPAPFLRHAPASSMAGRIAFLLLAEAVTFLIMLAPLLAGAALLFWGGFGWRPADFFVALGVTVALTLIAAVASVACLRRLETTDPTEDRTPDAEKVAALVVQEGAQELNLLASCSVLKPGWFRSAVLRFAFGSIARENRWADRPGFLGTMGVIHFARWVRLPGTNRLLFWSNHDGSWESYVETFIQQASHGVNAIWSNARGFPRTRFLLLGGATDGDRLRRWARNQQFLVPFWYSAYPDLTLARIRRNAAIRQGIATIATGSGAAEWLSCFGSGLRAQGQLAADDIPTLVFGGRGDLVHCTCLILALADAAAACREWLRAISPSLTYGYRRDLDAAVAVAFSAAGLRRFGVDPADLATFGPAFQNGMASAARAAALGDDIAEARTAWAWGNAANPADAALILYATDAAGLAALRAAQLHHLAAHGHRVAHELCARELPAHGLPKEAFGFRDGISNPVLAGTPASRNPAARDHVVAAGEIVLGYPDNSGYVPATPMVASRRDPGRLLPDLPHDDPALRPTPRFEVASAPAWCDFGRNGSYLVIRQIEQDAAGFHAYVVAAAAAVARPPDWVAAKLVGRWPGGESLLRCPHQPMPAPHGPHADNDFLYAADDSDGLRCPLGAHIRRANPRDSFDASSPDQLAISNRHRILRVGRPYVPPPGGRPGLIFMCLNADIERQFEFVQQSWLLGRSFHALEDESDPLFTPCGTGGRFTIPTGQGPLRLAGLPAFTRVRGGEYFFMPGRQAIAWLRA